jgi:hypothetical protein
MAKEHHHHTAREHILFGRLLLLVVFVILCAAAVAFWRFSRVPLNPFPQMAGLVVGSGLVWLVLIGAIWLRHTMARTALVVFLWLVIFVFSMPGLYILNDRTIRDATQPLAVLVAGLFACLLANVVLITSRNIHFLGVPRGCAD